MRNGRKRGGKANNNKQQQRHEGEKDNCHSVDVPSCSLVRQVAEDVIPSAKRDKRGSEPSVLGRMVLRHLIDQQRNDQAVQESQIAKKKPKKRRKKKKTKTSVEGTEEAAPQTTDQQTSSNASSLLPVPTIAKAETEKSPRVPFGAEQMAMELMTANLLRWLGEERQDESSVTRNRDFISFVEKLDEKPRVPMADITKALSSIGCNACRSAAQTYWQQNGPGKDVEVLAGDGVQVSKTLILQPSMIVPALNPWDDRQVEQAFDYVAMEEGLGPEEADGDDVLVLRHVEGITDTLELVSPSTADAVTSLLYKFVLPSALPIEREAKERELSTKEYEAIIRQSIKREKQITSKLDGVRNKVNELEYKFASIEEQFKAYDAIGSDRLRECNSLCEALLSSMLDVILTSNDCFRQTSCSIWLQVKMELLWRSYDSCVQRMLNATMIHDGNFAQLANSPGKVQGMYVNASHRSSFRAMVTEKKSAVTGLYSSILSTLCNEVDSDCAPLLKKLVTSEAYVKVALKEPARKEKLDSLSAEVLKAYNQLTQTVLCGNVNEMFRKQQERCRRLSELLKQLDSLILRDFDASSPVVENSRWCPLRQDHEELVSSVTSAEVSGKVGQEELTREETTALLAELRLQLSSLTINEAATWRCFTSLKAAPRNASYPPIPRRLHEWMIKTSLSTKNRGIICRGGGGERRLAGIVTSLLYQWVADRAKEWHAGLTERELLESMDKSDVLNDLGTNEINKQSKSSRKRRKKKANGANVNRSSPQSGTASPVTGVDEAKPNENELSIDEEAAVLLCDSGSSDGNRSETKGQPTVTPTSALSTDGGIGNRVSEKKEKSSSGATRRRQETLNTATNPQEGRATPPEQLPTTKDTTASDENTRSAVLTEGEKVGVVDAKGFQSAEDFLMGRFNAVLALQGSSDVPIVIR